MQQTATGDTLQVPNPHGLIVPDVRNIRGELTYIEDTVQVAARFKEDPLGHMLSRKQITRSQFRAGRQWQALYEAAGPRMRSSGDLAEPVDGGGQFSEGITDRQLWARDELVKYRDFLGERQHKLIGHVLADKMSIWEATGQMFPNEITNARRTFTGHWFRECLTALGKRMGLSS